MESNYYLKTREWLQDSVSNYFVSYGNKEDNVEFIGKAISALDTLFDPNLAIHSVESRNVVFEAVDTIISTNNLLNDKQKTRCKDKFRKELEKNTNSFIFDVPQINPEVVKQFETLFEDIPKYPEQTQQQMLGFYHTIKHIINFHKYMRAKGPPGSFAPVLHTGNPMGSIGRFDHGQTIEYGPHIVALISKVVSDLPRLFKDRFSNSIICRVFTGQFCSLLAIGKTQKEALKILLSKIKKSNLFLCHFFSNLIEDISNIRKECLEIHPLRDDIKDGNVLGFFQLEFVHAYCNMNDKIIFSFDDPGLRKTATTLLALIVRLRRDGYGEGRILVDCPPNLIDMWKEEIEKRFNPNILRVIDIHNKVLNGVRSPAYPKNKFQIELVGHTVHSYKRTPPEEYLGIIVDEVHNFKQREKGDKSKRSIHITQYIQSIPYRIMATGTPLVNELSEFIFTINAFYGKQIIPEDSVKCAIGTIERAYLIQAYASPFIIRRRKRHIFDLPPKKINIEYITVGEKPLAIREDMKLSNCDKSGLNRNLADIARLEAPYKIESINKFIRSFPKKKGLVYSGWINQSDTLRAVTGKLDGVLFQAFRRCPRGWKKIYISGNLIVDINGTPSGYSFEKAKSVRKQFEKTSGGVVAYVSLQTSREGINEFGKGTFVSYLTLPFEHATLTQSEDRICRGINEIQNIHIPCIRYLDKNGKKFYYKNNKIKRSFDEQCIQRIMVKEQLSNVICDAIKRDFQTGDIEPWSVALEDFDSVLYIDPTPPKTKAQNGTYLARAMNELSVINPELVPKRIKQMNKEIKSDIFEEVESLKTAKDSLSLIQDNIKQIYQESGEKISFAHVGCGKAKLDETTEKKCKNIHRSDLYCKGKGIINCDRSEMNSPLVKGHCKDDSIDVIGATNMFHWQLDSGNINRDMVVNLSNTLSGFNKSLKVGGFCLITCPSNKYDYPFAHHKFILNRYGFELVENKEFKSVRCFLLKKKRHFSKEVSEKTLVRLSKLLPKQIGMEGFNEQDRIR